MTDLQPLVGERSKGETDTAIAACNDWLRLGPGRSIPALLAMYQDKVKIIRNFAPPSTSPKTLGAWSSKFKWPDRAAVFDVQWDAIQNEERARELNMGLALDYERVRRLKQLADFLEGQLYERTTDGKFPNIWNPDVKSVGAGEDMEIVEIERFNAALIREYRETLNDLAKEVGGRIQKQEVSGKGGGAVQHEHNVIVYLPDNQRGDRDLDLSDDPD